MDEIVRFNQAVAALTNAQNVLVITGAGISAASGLPTYRGIGGLYTGFHLLPPEIMMSGWLRKYWPSLVDSKIEKMYRKFKDVKPNAAHEAIFELSAFKQVTVLTQNVDGLHTAAGNEDVIEIHGNVTRFMCTTCGSVDTTSKTKLCKACGRNTNRPDVVLFGESLKKSNVNAILKATSCANLVIVAGTTAMFPYVRYPVECAKAFNKPVIVVDPTPSKSISSTANFLFQIPAQVFLPRLVQAAWVKLSSD